MSEHKVHISMPQHNGEELAQSMARLLEQMDTALDNALPEGDAVDIMRKAANGGFKGSIGHVVKNAKQLLGMDPYNGEDREMMGQLADMVERDYVRRDAVENHPEWIANLKCSEWMEKIHKLERERDEWKAKAEDASTGECEKLPSLTDMECIVRMGDMERHCGYWRCSECGCENFEGAKHCMNCGRKGVERWARI